MLLYTPLSAVYGWGVLGHDSTLEVSCCYSLPTAMLHRRALATTAVHSLQQQWLLSENDVFTKISRPGPKTSRLSSCPPSLPPSKSSDDGSTASLSALSAVALSFSPPDFSLRLSARHRLSRKRLAPQSWPFLPHRASMKARPCSNAADP